MTQRIAQNADGSVWMEWREDELTYAVWWGNEKGFLGLAMKNIFGWSVARNDSTPTHRHTEPDAVQLLWHLVNQD